MRGRTTLIHDLNFEAFQRLWQSFLGDCATVWVPSLAPFPYISSRLKMATHLISPPDLLHVLFWFNACFTQTQTNAFFLLLSHLSSGICKWPLCFLLVADDICAFWRGWSQRRETGRGFEISTSVLILGTDTGSHSGSKVGPIQKLRHQWQK